MSQPSGTVLVPFEIVLSQDALGFFIKVPFVATPDNQSRVYDAPGVVVNIACLKDKFFKVV